METSNTPPEGNAPEYSGSGGSNNGKFYAFLVAIVVLGAIVVLAWALNDDGEDIEKLALPLPSPITITERGLYELPNDIRFRLDFDGSTIYANDAQFRNNCSMMLDDWWEWRNNEDDFGYYNMKGPLTLIGEIRVYDLSENVLANNPGTPTETSE